MDGDCSKITHSGALSIREAFFWPLLSEKNPLFGFKNQFTLDEASGDRKAALSGGKENVSLC